jgi:hypothetical protein
MGVERGGVLCNSHKREIAKVGPEPHCPVYELLRTFRSKLDYLCAQAVQRCYMDV